MNRRSVSRTVLSALWAVSVLSFAAGSFTGTAAVFFAVGIVSALLYIPFVVWYLTMRGTPHIVAPDAGAGLFMNKTFARGLLKIFGAILAIFIVGAVLTVQLSIHLFLAAASILLIIRYYAKIDRYAVVVSFLIGFILLISEYLVARGSEHPLDLYMAFYLATIPFICLGGILAYRLSGGFGRVLILEKRFLSAAWSFLAGFLLALPPALVNIAAGGKEADARYDEFWKPFVGALIPGFAEEIWARLFIVSFCFIILRPNTGEKPARAAVAAILISAFIHAFWHFPVTALPGGGAIMGTLNALMFGVPMALLFVKRDLESAIGFHYALDFVRFMAAV